MKLTKDQQKELKKIDSTISKIVRISATGGLNLDNLVLEYNAGAPDITIIDRENMSTRSKSRQEVFRRSQKQQQSKKVNIARR